MAAPSEIEDFLQGPLVTWLQSCLADSPDRISSFEDLADGMPIHEVLLLIDPEPLYHGVMPSHGNAATRVRNFDCIIKNIKTLYEEELCQLIVSLPDCVRLGRDLQTKEGLEDLQLLLLLLLGCAVQCPNKQTFIEGIKSLPVDAQHGLVHCIKQVTESQQIVLTPDSLESLDSLPGELLLRHVRHLIKQRDRYLQYWAGQEERKGSGSAGTPTVAAITGERGESQHLAVELADWKARLRKQRQELEEKSEALAEVKDELEHNRSLVTKLRAEMQDLKQQARATKAYRDELDSLREKSERCDRLEAEVARYRDKLSDLEFYRSRVDELREDNRVLEETREMLEEQLARARKRGDHTVELEASILQFKQTINDLILERDSNHEKLQQMFEENAELSLLSRSQLNNSNQDDNQLDEDTDTGSGDNSLSEQLTSNAQARALRLELENRRLAQTLESLQESAFQQTNEHILELEKEKKKLSLMVEDLETSKRKLVQQNSDLENTVKNAQRDTKKMQELRDSLQLQLEIRGEEAEGMTRDRQRLERRVLELEAGLEAARAQADRVQEQHDADHRAATLERDVNKLKEALEAKSVTLDQVTIEAEKNLKEKLQFSKRLEEVNTQLTRFQDVEREMSELERQRAVDKATINALQSDLVAEKLNTKELKANLDKLGLPLDQLSNPDNALDRLLSSPEVLSAVRARLAEDTEVTARAARLEVDVATQQSQISSLTSQLTALQLANSQLVAEKEEVLKNYGDLQNEHQQMLVDQLTLQTLHEQLTSEYDGLVKEKEGLKASHRDLRTEHRLLKDNYDILSASIEALRTERDGLRDEGRSLANLRAEHSKLKDDFRNLFTASEKVKSEYRGLQEEYKNTRAEAGRLRLTVTELQGELAARTDRTTTLEVQLSKVSSQCELLSQVKQSLEEDRRSLMEHVSLLLSQYHELLTHSLEDKEHYHTEEKLFRDKLNNLCRQKEKLEEKIMEHYRRLDSCPTKKKSFGANLVRRVRKAGSDLISKSRRSWHEDSARRPGTDSDTSLEDVRTRQDGLSGLGTPGTRRAVYYSAEDNNSASNENEETKSTSGDIPPSSTPQPDSVPPLGNNMVVYNRVTNVIGGSATPPLSPHHSKKSGQPPASETKSGHPPVWYEYGCV